MTKDSQCTIGIKPCIVMVKKAFSKTKSFYQLNWAWSWEGADKMLYLEYCSLWVRMMDIKENVKEIPRGSKVWCWGRIEKIKWAKYQRCLKKSWWGRSILISAHHRKTNYIRYSLRWNFWLCYIITEYLERIPDYGKGIIQLI